LSWVTAAFGRWYLTVYPHRDGSEAERLVRTLDGIVGLAGARVLDVGCGPGRHLPAFAAAGARPAGIDLSGELLREALRVRAGAGGAWPLVRADMRALPVGHGAMDVVTSLFTSFGYFREEEDRRVLAEAARVLRAGGYHVLDFLNRGQALRHPSPRTERRSGEWIVREERRIEDDRRVVKRVVVGPATGGPAVADYEERVTLYPPSELRALLAAHGLRPVRELGEYDGAPFDPARSSRFLVVSRRESP
jgi:SAM-dependent methyltransferase